MTKELIGAELDAAVARALGWTVWAEFGLYRGDPVWRTTKGDPDRVESPTRSNFHPSTDWSQGGPIIEREHIGVFGVRSGWGAIVIKPEYWERFSSWDTTMLDATGPTPLIAAMRAFVAANLDRVSTNAGQSQDGQTLELPTHAKRQGGDEVKRARNASD